MSQVHSEMTTNRLEAFSDGVFAIVMTLLVFELKVPQVVGQGIEFQLLERLGAMWPKLLSFVLSFVIVGIFWVAHHSVFHRIRRTDRPLMWLNNLVLMCVAFIPFPTALMGEYVHYPVALVPYGITLALCGSSMLLLWHYAVTRGLLEPDVDPELVRLIYRRAVKAPIGYVVAVLVSLINPRVTLALYALIPVLYIIPGGVDRHLAEHRRNPRGSAASKGSRPSGS